MTTSTMDVEPTTRKRAKLHPVSVRIMHWINALAIIIMIMSGWGIYNDEVIFGSATFPHFALLGDWAPQHLQWHFLAMWVLLINGVAYLIYGLTTGRFRQKFLPIRFHELVQVVRETLKLHLAHEDLTTYNAIQKVLYIGVILAAILQVVTGLAIWKPVQFSGLTALFYDFQGARIAHFAGMAAIVGFLLVHVALALLVPRTLVAMVTGGPDISETPRDDVRMSPAVSRKET